LLKATFKAFSILVGKPPEMEKDAGGKSGKIHLDTQEVARLMGGIWADGSLTKKQQWLVGEVLKVFKESEVKGEAMEVDH
jgi:hypothetical protein